MNYLQIARETLSVESQALAQLSQRLDDEFSQVVDLIPVSYTHLTLPTN